MRLTSARDTAAQRALTFTSAARTHVGKVRSHNEDRHLCRDAAGLWVVADGMGGHEGGELAAGLLVDALDSIDLAGPGPARLDAVRGTVEQVNHILVRTAAENSAVGTIGTTVAALIVHQGHFACMWAGDSRGYLLREGKLARVTHDHSFVQTLVDSGALGEAEARAHPHANIITRAVGIDAAIAIDSRHGPVLPGDLFLLCSDGLSGMVGDADIERMIGEGPIEAVADALLARALENGGRDNVTLVLIKAEAA